MLRALRCRGSPLSQKLSLRELRQGARSDLGQCLRTEFRLAAHILREKSDFAAGVTALLIDKSGPASWQPPTLEEVRCWRMPACCASLGSIVLHSGVLKH